VKKKNLIKIINEEISEFDFLGNEAHSKEEEIINILKNEEFQKQFICDSLLNKKNKIKIDILDSRIDGNWDEEPENATKLIIEYLLKIDYKYDQTKEPIQFELNFYGDDVSIRKDEWYNKGNISNYIEPEGDVWFSSFYWNEIKVILNTTEGDEIDFIAFKKAPVKIQTLFIREYTQDYIGSYTNLDVRTPEMKDKVQNVPYC
jgi:hypothetical protein